MRLFVVEDELFHLEDILITIETLGHKCVGNGKDPMDVLDNIEKSQPDVILMDIHLDENFMGIRLARKIKALYQIPIIFTSSDRSKNVINEALDIEPITYLVKPIQEGDLLTALVQAERQIVKSSEQADQAQELYVKKANKLVKVKINDILFAYSDSKNYCSFIVVGGEKFTFRNSITQFLKLLPATTFIQTHRGYLVNLRQIKHFDERNQVLIVEENEIPVGRTYKSELMRHLNIL